VIRPRYTLTETAAADLEAIWDFIAQDSEGAATRVFNEILDACDELGGQPGLGHAREDLSSGRPLLFWSVYNYLVVYRRDRTPIEVIAVVHGARDVETVLRVR
jgi:plasmid stabilization system protein ParE